MARELEIKVTADIAQAVEALRRAQTAIDGMGDSSEKTDKQVAGLEKDVQGLGKTLDDKVRKLVAAGTAAYALQKGISFLADSIKLVGGVALTMNANLEKSTMQFTTLMGDADKAEKHVRSLFEFAKKTPFETGPIIAASKNLELFGGAALNNERLLTKLGDASAASGAQFEELSFWVGRMYSSIQAGKPFGEAAMRLQELGVLSPIARQGIENLAASGSNATEVFGLFEDSLAKFTGAMDIQANTWEGLTSTITDAVQITIADALEPMFELLKTGAQIIVQVLGSNAVQQVFKNVAESVKNAFGPNPQDLVKSMLQAFVLFGEGALIVSDVVVRALSGVKLAFSVAAWTIAQTNSALNGFSDAMAESAKSSFDGMMGNSVFTKSLQGATQILETMRQEIGKVTIAQTANTSAMTTAASATKQVGDAMARLTAAAEMNPKAVEKARKEWEKFNNELDKFNEKSSQRMSLNKVVDFGGDAYIKAYESQLKFENSVKSFTSGSRAIWEPFKEAATKAVDGVQSRFSNFKSAFEGLGPAIVGAIQGGGSVGGTIGAVLGQGLGKDLGNGIARMVSGTVLGPTIGKALGSLGGPLGAIAGQLGGELAGKLFGKLFGPSQQKQVTDMRNKLLGAAGGLDVLRERAQRAGVSMDNIMSAKTTQALQNAMDVFNRSLEEAEERTRNTREAMERWGLTIDDMGPKFAEQEINDKLLAIVKDMELLTSAGADFNVVAGKMAPEISKLVQASITAGTAIPREMEPILKKMFEMGMLTDASGKALEDFGALTFAEDLNKQFSLLISKMDALLDKLFGMEDSLDRSRRTAGDVSGIIETIDPPSWAVDGIERVGFDRGGVVGRDYRPPSSRDIIPALLRPGEVVLTPEQARAPRAGGPAVNVVINVAGYLDSPTARTGLADIVRDELSKNLRRVGRAA